MVEPTSHSDATRLNASPSLGVFVGRQREMAGLRTVLDDAISGQGRLVMLTGEPGIGKTRVAQELAGAAESQGMRVFWGRCYEGLGAPPSGLGCSPSGNTSNKLTQRLCALRWDPEPPTSQR